MPFALELIVGLLVIAAPELVKSIRRRRVGGALTPNTPGQLPPSNSRASRRTRIRPAQPRGRFDPDRLANYVRCSGRAPLERHPHRRRIVDAWRAFTVDVLTVATTPKPDFTISSWRIDTKSTQDSDAGCSRPDGFILSATLHEGENRYHLRRSLRSAKLQNPSKQLVVILSASEVAEPTANVRCMVVDSYSLDLPKGKTGRLAISNADPLECNGTISYCAQLGEIPLDAIRLISTTPHFPPPSSNWGSRAELLESYPLHAAQDVSLQSACDHADDYVTGELRRLRRARIHMLFLPGALAAAYLYGLWWWYRLTEQSADFFRNLTVTMAALVIVYLTILVPYVVYFAKESARARRWCRREDMSRRDWKGGTSACLVVGSLLRRGPQLRKDDWNRFWEDEIRSSGELSKHGEPDAIAPNPID